MDKARSEDHWHKRWHLKSQDWRRSPAWAEQYTFRHTEEEEEQLAKGNEEEGLCWRTGEHGVTQGSFSTVVTHVKCWRETEFDVDREVTTRFNCMEVTVVCNWQALFPVNIGTGMESWFESARQGKVKKWRQRLQAGHLSCFAVKERAQHVATERNDNANGMVKKQILVNDGGRQGGIRAIDSNVAKQSRGEWDPKHKQGDCGSYGVRSYLPI